MTELDEMFNKFEKQTEIMIDNMIGVPLLASFVAQFSVDMANNPNVKTEKSRNDYLIDKLINYSDEIKKQGGSGYMLFDQYIETLKSNVERSQNELAR